MEKIIGVILISTYFLKIVKNADTIRFIKGLFDFYRTKLFPYLKNIDSNFMKVIRRYRSEKPVLKTLRTSYNTAFTTLHGSHHGVFF